MTLHPLAFLLIYAAVAVAGFLVGYVAGKDRPTQPDRDARGQSHVNWRTK